jgi:ubiquinone/menaquinone biosynthesis C-methylase UbiE
MRNGHAASYHLQELAIATDRGAPGHVMPQLPGEGSRILDVGCGAGQTLIAGLPPDAFGVGVDVDAAALRLGRSLTERVAFACSRAESLPFPDDYFDAVISRVALPYTNIRRSLAEMRRVLKPDGQVWLVLHPLRIPLRMLAGHVRRVEPRGALHQLFVIGNGVVFHLFGRTMSLRFRGAEYCESFQTQRGMRAALRTAGFGRIVTERGKFFTSTARKMEKQQMREKE